MILGVRRFPLIPTILVLAAAGTMVALGVWQLGRAEEKDALIAEYAANQERGTARGVDPRDMAEFLYRTVEYRCDDPTNWQAVAGRNRAGESGFEHRFTCTPAAEGVAPSPDRPAIAAAIGWSNRPAMPDWQGGTIEGVVAPMANDFKIVLLTPPAGLEPLARPDPNDLPDNHMAYAGQWFFFALTALLIYVLALRRRERD